MNNINGEIISFEEFRKIVISELRKNNQDMKISIHSWDEKNGISQKNIIAENDEWNMHLARNLHELYKNYIKRKQGIDEYLKVLQSSIDGVKYFASIDDPRIMHDYDYMKKFLYVQLIRIKGNEAFLSECPHRIIGDMAMIYMFSIGRDDYFYRAPDIQITNAALCGYGVSEDQLYNDAMVFAPINADAYFEPIAGKYPLDEEDFSNLDSRMFVAGTIGMDGIYGGAEAIVYPGFLKDISVWMDGNLYIMPLGTEISILVKDDGTINREFFETMRRNLFKNEFIYLGTVLSDEIYYYQKNQHKFVPAKFDGSIKS